MKHSEKIMAAAELVEERSDIYEFMQKINSYPGKPGEIRVSLDTDHLCSRNYTYSSNTQFNSFLKEIIIKSCRQRINDIDEILAQKFSFKE